MNEIVSKFIEEQKKKKAAEQLIRRKKHLLDLGLVDDANSSKQYCPKDFLEWQRKEYGYIYQDEQGYFKYKGNPVAIEVTDEEYEEICKICPPNETKKNEKIETIEKNNKLLNTRKILLIIVGSLSFLWGLISLFKVEYNRYGGDAFTGIQNASAQTAAAVDKLMMIIGMILIVIGATTNTKK